jgi:mRNA interferase HicA
MNSAEFIKLLKKHGFTFENHRGGSGHQTVRRGDKKTVVSVHGSGQDLGKGYVLKVMKQLGIKT